MLQNEKTKIGYNIPVSGLYYVQAHGAPHIPNYGPSHGTPHGTPYGLQYGHKYQPYGYGYQQPAYSSNYGFVAPHSQGTPHHNASM